MEHLKTGLEKLFAWIPIAPSMWVDLFFAVMILLVGVFFARLVRRTVRRTALASEHIDNTLGPVIASLLYYGLIVLSIYAAMEQLKISVTGLLAVFGAAGLAVGLALKDTLGNVASGIMVILLRPITVGEYISTPEISGTVEEIGLFATQVRNSEGVLTFVPNHAVWQNRITNYNRHDKRQLIMNIHVGYGTDLEKTVRMLTSLLAARPETVLSPPPQVLVTDFTDNGIALSLRAWLPGTDWMKNTSNIRMAVKSALDEDGVNMSFPHRVIINRDA